MSVSAYDRKVDLAKSIIDEHNAQLRASGPPTETSSGPVPALLSWDEIFAKLRQLGGTTDDALKNVTWEDLQECGVPRILARRLTNDVFRKTEKADKPFALKQSQVSAMSFEELFANYDPLAERNATVTARLMAEAGNRRCVVFNHNGTVNAEESARILRELKSGLAERESTFIRYLNKPVKIYRIGETNREVFWENPLYPGEALREETCDHTGASWAKIPLEARQIIYLAVKTGELKINDVEDAHRVISMLDCDSPLDKVQARYHKAAIALQDLQAVGNAPLMRIKRQNGKEGKEGKEGKGPSDDPFFQSHKRF